MAALDLQEQEQIENLKHIWKRWGMPVTLGVLALVVGYGSVAGWRAWNEHKAEQASRAFMPFNEALKTAKPDVKKVGQLADVLAREHATTGYATQAVLIAAALEVEAKNWAGAEKRLQWVLTHQKDEALLALARLRMAAVQLNQNKIDAALATLKAEHPPEFASVYAETRGDALLLKNDKAGARQAWQAAMADADDQRKKDLESKLLALGS